MSYVRTFGQLGAIFQEYWLYITLRSFYFILIPEIELLYSLFNQESPSSDVCYYIC